MSIIADIRQRKAEYERHLASHKCGELTKCPERSKLRQEWISTAGKWGTEPDDHDRQKEHARQNEKRPAA